MSNARPECPLGMRNGGGTKYSWQFWRDSRGLGSFGGDSNGKMYCKCIICSKPRIKERINKGENNGGRRSHRSGYKARLEVGARATFQTLNLAQPRSRTNLHSGNLTLRPGR